MKCSRFAAILGTCLSVPLTATYASTFTFNCGSPPASSTLNGAFAGTTAWTNNGSGSPGTGIPTNGDIVALTGICAGDVVVTESGINIIGATGNPTYQTNYNPNTTGAGTPVLSNYSDGINGQINLGGVQRVTINGLQLSGTALSTSNMDPANDIESADVYAHDASAVVLRNDYIGPGNLVGVFLLHSATAQLFNSLVTGVGTANTSNYQSGVTVMSGSTARLGQPNGAQASTVTANANGNGITVLQSSEIELYHSTVSDNGISQIYGYGGSSAHITGSTVTVGISTNGAPAVQLLDTSSAQIDGASTVDATASTTAGAVLIVGAGAVVLNNSTFLAVASSAPTLQASSAASIILAGGNTVTATSGGLAIEVDHTASLFQQQGTAFGYQSASETVNGKGQVVMQSSADLGQGPIAGQPSITWTGGIQVQQNSSFRMQGGATITGRLTPSAASNGFFNCTNSGGSCGAAGAANNIDGGVVCSQNNPPGNPSPRVQGPTLVTPNVTTASQFGPPASSDPAFSDNTAASGACGVF